jgi:Mg/Co/Ni transporter MgtE
LYIHFTVEFTEKITEEQSNALRKMFGAPQSNGTSTMNEEDIEEVAMVTVADIEEEIKRRKQYERTSGAYNSDRDDEMGDRPRGVSCAQQ